MELEITQDKQNLKLLFSDDVGKFGTNEILDEYFLTNDKLLNILQKHDEMLEMLNDVKNYLLDYSPTIEGFELINDIDKLIKEATGL